MILFFIPILSYAQDLIDSKKFEAESIKKVELRVMFVDVVVSGRSGDLVSFDGRIEGPRKYRDDISIESELEGDILKVWIEKHKNTYGNIGGRIDLGIPEGVELDIAASSGNISAKDLVAKEIKLTCSSGNIKANRLTGNVTLKTSSGNISSFTMMGQLSANASSGNIEIDNAEGIISVKASSGNLQLSNLTDAQLNAVTSSGNIYLNRSIGSFSAKCTSGNIKGANVELTGDSNFTTTSGTINIDVNNAISDLSINLSSNSGMLSAGRRKRVEKKLVMNSGKIGVRASSSSGNIGIY
ncbi:MAG: DUF4097 family beta strand repeat-containing protein [Cyclobacteriaceae bacterium]